MLPCQAGMHHALKHEVGMQQRGLCIVPFTHACMLAVCCRHGRPPDRMLLSLWALRRRGGAVAQGPEWHMVGQGLACA